MGGTVIQSFESITNHLVDIEHRWDVGRVDGYIEANNLKTLANQPAVRSIALVPEYHVFNDNSRSHMSVNTMKTYFNTNLDGSNQIIAVADAGLDEDHGDFGTRIIGSYDVIGDGSTADKHSGHGTHVSCTVLGDGFRGGYAGVAPEAELYFQQWKTTTQGIFSRLHSIVCSMFPTMQVLEFIRIHGALLRQVNKENTIQTRRMLMITPIITTGTIPAVKDLLCCLPTVMTVPVLERYPLLRRRKCNFGW